jgi:hypothetical protein
MRRLVNLMLSALVLSVPVAVFAQPTSTVTASAAPSEISVPPSVAAPEEPSSEELLTMSQKVVNDFRSVGVLAGVTGLAWLLVNITKLAPINSWLVARKKKWIRPLLAVIAGGLTGAAGSVAVDVNTVLAIIHGAFLGGSAIGWHEVIEAVKGNRSV